MATAKGTGVWLGRPEAAGRALMPSALTDIQPGHRFFAPAHDVAPESPPLDLELNGATGTASSVSENTFTFAGGAFEDYLKMEISYCV